MDLVKVPAVLAHWWWVVLAVVLVTGAAMISRFSMAPPAYEAQVRVQITAPPVEDLSLVANGNRSSSFVRDDVTLAHNNFVAVVKSREVYDRTGAALNLSPGDAPYSVVVRPVVDSDFVDLVATASTPALAESIANTHAGQALAYYGELRAKPAAATSHFLSEQLATARTTLLAASSAAADGPQGPASPAAVVQAQQARSAYELLLTKQAETALTEQQAMRSAYIQIVEPAMQPTEQARVRTFGVVLGLGIVGSLGLGTLLALLLEAVFGRQTSTVKTVRTKGAALGEAVQGPAQVA